MTINRITYLKDIIPNDMFCINNPYITRFYFNDYIEISQFLNQLEKDKAYVVSFEFICSWLMYEQDDPTILLSKPILVTKNSNPRVISEHIKSRIQLNYDSYLLSESFLEIWDKIEVF